MCGGWTIKNFVNAKLRTRLVQVLEETSPAAEQHGGQRDFQLINDIKVQALLDHVRATGDTNVPAACRFPGQLEGQLSAQPASGKRRNACMAAATPNSLQPGFDQCFSTALTSDPLHYLHA